MEEFFVDIALPASMYMVVIGAVVAILASIYHSLDDPKKLVRSLVGLGVLAVVFFVGYTTADTEITTAAQKKGLESGEVQMIGAVLNMMYLLIFVAVLGILANFITGLISKS